MSVVATGAGMDGSDRRIEGIDMARALALMGMLAVHFGPTNDRSLAGQLYALPHGRASVLFVVLAGIGVSLLARSDVARARWRLAGFALVLLPLGLTLELLDNRVAVILHHYAAFFLLGAVALRLPTSPLLGAALVMTVLGPAVYFAGRAEWPDLFTRSSVSLWRDPVTIGRALLISGPYPLLTWAGALLWGMYLGRKDLRSPRLAAVLVGCGIAVAVGTVLASNGLTAMLGRPAGFDDFRVLLTTRAHSQMPLWLVQAMASASAVLGLSLLLARVAGRLVTPLAMLGRMALSAYVLHLLILTGWPDLLRHGGVGHALTAVLSFSAVAALLAMLWRPLGRGPLETVMHALADRMGRLAGAKRTDDAGQASGGRPWRRNDPAPPDPPQIPR
ncbi:MAG TPA: heparan-alpha-glucosaminide N-acetyltransferase domain-containing protein [Devosia sp.]|jgi:uncharacterized membrane protein|nr:heparan-alpha-glucosaminide N-acetyltransferase domain-containing protein [Devosia sp.]